MINFLETILKQKQAEVELLKQQQYDLLMPIVRGEKGYPKHKSFKQSLTREAENSLAVIAEVKRRSPSKGKLADIADPLALIEAYSTGGANAISILTDEKFFAGHINDLTKAALHLKHQPQTILRKDFIIDEMQIAESVAAGADAILLIVAVLKERTHELIAKARAMHIDVLVEVHDANELEIALASGADIIGINNRNLNTFKVDTERSLQLVKTIPDHIVTVAESGISNADIAHQYYNAGFDAVLIGEALVKSSQPHIFMREIRNAKNTD